MSIHTHICACEKSLTCCCSTPREPVLCLNCEADVVLTVLEQEVESAYKGLALQVSAERVN